MTLAVGIILGLISGGVGDDSDPNDVGPTPTLAVELPEIVADSASLERAVVDRVIDGDTIDVRVGGEIERVRYYGVDTPERGEDCYGEAKDRNEALAGAAVLLLPDARERDDFDRLLRYVFQEDGASIDARLVAEGLGEAWRRDGTYRDELVSLEEDVRAQVSGCLWGG